MARPGKRIMVVAGDPSGDLHAARVAAALRRQDPSARLFGMGGPALAAAGADIRDDLTRPAVMGFVEVVKHLPLLKRRFALCEKWLAEEKPDLLWLVDYPGFNLRLAKKAHALGVPVCYYIAPQVWAWHRERLALMKKVIGKLLVILPFEREFFRKEGMKAVYVGNPLLEEVPARGPSRLKALKKAGLSPAAFPLISAMPGSRKAEVERIWPLYLAAARRLRSSYPDIAFLVPKPKSLAPEDYPGLLPDDPFYFLETPAFDARRACDLAWVKSGTSTLETALLGTPQVLVYKVAALTGWLAKRLLKIRYVGLVNLLAPKPQVPELLQERATPEALVEETERILGQPKAREAQLKSFAAVKKGLATPRPSSSVTAREILKFLREGA
ncbi:MAG TPA: lipid-A-disaccharide synthase, partial [bacterium]|nr:lipid-A-disaccharide synthase [bacterium]